MLNTALSVPISLNPPGKGADTLVALLCVRVSAGGGREKQGRLGRLHIWEKLRRWQTRGKTALRVQRRRDKRKRGGGEGERRESFRLRLG